MNYEQYYCKIQSLEINSQIHWVEFNKYQDGLNNILDLTINQTFNTKPKRNELFKNSFHITMHCGNY